MRSFFHTTCPSLQFLSGLSAGRKEAGPFFGVAGQSPMIRTNHGPVGLRQPRKPEVIKPAVGEKKDVKVFKNWLASKKGGKKDDNKSDAYRTLIKQTMLLAAAKMEIDDIAYGSPNVAVDEKTGLYRPGLLNFFAHLFCSLLASSIP